MSVIEFHMPDWPWWLWVLFFTALGFFHGFGRAIAEDIFR